MNDMKESSLKRAVRFTAMLLAAALVALLVAGIVRNRELAAAGRRRFAVAAAATADTLAEAMPRLLHPSGRPHLGLVLELARRRLGAARVTVVDEAGRPCALSEDPDLPKTAVLRDVFARNLHHGPVFLGRLTIERGMPSPEGSALPDVRALLVGLFVAWLVAEGAMWFLVVSPLRRLQAALAAVEDGRASPVVLRRLVGRNELTDIGTTVADLLDGNRRSSRRLEAVPVPTTRLASAGTRN